MTPVSRVALRQAHAEVLRAGPVSLTLDAGAVRWVMVDGEEAVRGIGMAVRDERWATIPPRFTEYRVTRRRDGFSVRLAAEHVEGEVDFSWQGEIEGRPDGTIRYAVDGIARHPFLRARIGLFVLHPDALAGRPVRVQTPFGTVHARLPREVAPVAPVSMVRTLAHRLASGGGVELAFTGDLFEMEDQRNFGDASFKTYSTPLCIPYPVRLEAGARVTQSVTLATTTTPPARARRASRPAAVAEVTVGRTGHPMPSLGLGAADARTVIADRTADLVRALGLGHIRVTVDTTGPRAADTLAEGLRQARLAGAPVELALVTDLDGTGVEAAVARCRADGVSLARVLVFDRDTSMTTRAAARRTRDVLRARGDPAPVAGGSAAWFDLVNMHAPPVDELDELAFGMCPRAHAVDDATVMENVATLRAQVATAVARWPGLPLAIGPVGIAYPFDPWAADPDPASAGSEPSAHDPRHRTLFGAAWTLGALAHAAGPGVVAVTLRELAGRSGVVDAAEPWLPDPGPSDRPAPDDGTVVPAYIVLADALELGPGARRLRSQAPRGVACLALAAGARRRVLVANLSSVAREVQVRIPGGHPLRIRTLDAAALAAATRDPAACRADPGTALDRTDHLTIGLAPYAIARIDAATQRHAAGPRGGHEEDAR